MGIHNYIHDMYLITCIISTQNYTDTHNNVHVTVFHLTTLEDNSSLLSISLNICVIDRGITPLIMNSSSGPTIVYDLPLRKQGYAVIRLQYYIIIIII